MAIKSDINAPRPEILYDVLFMRIRRHNLHENASVPPTSRNRTRNWALNYSQAGPHLDWLPFGQPSRTVGHISI